MVTLRFKRIAASKGGFLKRMLVFAIAVPLCALSSLTYADCEGFGGGGIAWAKKDTRVEKKVLTKPLVTNGSIELNSLSNPIVAGVGCSVANRYVDAGLQISTWGGFRRSGMTTAVQMIPKKASQPFTVDRQDASAGVMAVADVKLFCVSDRICARAGAGGYRGDADRSITTTQLLTGAQSTSTGQQSGLLPVMTAGFDINVGRGFTARTNYYIIPGMAHAFMLTASAHWK